MLNKKLLLDYNGMERGHIKIVCSRNGGRFIGYNVMGTKYGSVSRLPCWNSGSSLIEMVSLAGYDEGTSALFGNLGVIDAKEVSVTVVEKKKTVVLKPEAPLYTRYISSSALFDYSDDGKTYTIVFDPEPSGYK